MSRPKGNRVIFYYLIIQNAPVRQDIGIVELQMHKTNNDALFDKSDICKHIHVPATFGDDDWL